MFTIRFATAAAALAVAVAGGVLALTLAGGVGGPGPTPSPSASPSPSTTGRACGLVSVAEIHTIVQSADRGILQAQPGPGPIDWCLYGSAGETLVSVLYAPTDGRASFESAKEDATVAAASAGVAVDVREEIGPENFVDPWTEKLYVLKEDKLVIVGSSATAFGIPPNRIAVEVQVANLIAGRI
jgi:hypothetical protein